MERVSVMRQYLKAAHYFFYSMVVLSLTSAIIFWDMFTRESVVFVIYCMLYANVSVWLAYFFYKDYRQELQGTEAVRRYIKPYAMLSVFVVLGAEALAIMAPDLGLLLVSLLFINFYYIFIVIIGLSLYLLKPVRRLFQFETGRTIKNGKKIAAGLSRMRDVRSYRPGTDPIMDEMFEDVWEHRDYPVSQVQRVEAEFINRRIRDVEHRIYLEERRESSPMIMKRLEGEKQKYEKMLEDVMGYEG
jgi:hypothetical protein